MKDKLYLSTPQMKSEIERCLQCPDKPCQKACPVSCNPAEFISFAKKGDYDGAVHSICMNNPMGQTCGLVCPYDFCMKACSRAKVDYPIQIPKLQATILNKYRKNCVADKKRITEKTVAIMGAGPAGLAAAERLSSKGIEVTIFEKTHRIGGALNLIPKDRLPTEVIENDGEYIFSSDLVKIFYSMKISSPQVLLCNFDAVIVATGESNCKKLNIKGEDLSLPYMTYLENASEYITSGSVAVIGGGRVALDCALTAKKQGACVVDMFVRRKLSDMKIDAQEYLEIIDHEIDVTTMTSPQKIIKKGDLLYLHTCRNMFVENKLTPQKKTNIVRGGYDYIIKAVGGVADKFPDNESVFYAGDCKTGGSTVVEALASGQLTANKVYDYLSSEEQGA